MNKIYVRTDDENDWKKLLAKDYHWKREHSLWAEARTWLQVDAFRTPKMRFGELVVPRIL